MSSPHPTHLVLLLLLLTISTTSALVGSWKPIANPSDPAIQDIGKFAVTENNRKTGAGLVFVKVVSGQSQVVSGIQYRVVIEASGKTYEAVVWEKAWESFRKLMSFGPKA